MQTNNKTNVKVTNPSNNSITSINNIGDAKVILADTKLTDTERINILITGTDKTVVPLAKALQDYATKMSSKSPVRPAKQMVADNYALYNRLLAVVSNADYAVFNTLFDIVNLFFRVYAKDAFDIYKLTRFDMEWTWGDKELRTYNYLVTIITKLLDHSTRTKVIKTISLRVALNRETTKFTTIATNNIKRYYGV